MTTHELKTCPRCQTEFECKSGSILLCQCQSVILSPEQHDAIALQFQDCLCASCLQWLGKEYAEQRLVKQTVEKLSGDGMVVK